MQQVPNRFRGVRALPVLAAFAVLAAAPAAAVAQERQPITHEAMWLAFAARRDGDEAAQLYVLDLAAGGEATADHDIVDGCVVAAVEPGRPKPPVLEQPVSGPVRRLGTGGGGLGTAQPALPCPRVRRLPDPQLGPLAGRPAAAAVHGRRGAGAQPVDLLGGSALVAEPGFGGSADLQAVWTPDGSAIVFVATTTRHTAAFADVPSHLYRFDAGRRAGRADARRGQLLAPAFSPDGRTLYAS
jgi:hypothetical protein